MPREPVPETRREADAASDPSSSPLDLRDEARAHLFAIDAPPTLRAAAIGTWRARMVNEHGSARVFDAIARQLDDAGLPAAWSAECTRFAVEERRHGALCGSVVASLGGEARAPALGAQPVPDHGAVDRTTAVLRNLISVGCMSETVAVALIGAEREEMPDGPLRALLTSIWRDEIGHARFGWRLVEHVAPSLSAERRAAVDRYLPVAFAHLESHELAHLPLEARYPAGGAALGLCGGEEARALLYATIAGVIVPRLDAHGFAASRAWTERPRATA